MSTSKRTTPYFPETLSESFFLLKERGFITPNMLSEYIGSQLMKMAALAAVSTPPDSYDISEYTSQKTHSFELDRAKNGAQTLKATSLHSKAYQVYFAGNAQDALEPNYIKKTLQAEPNKNYIFWDYPGASRYKGVNRFDLLFKAGYRQIKKLLDEGVPAKDITLYGYSMGGGIAAHITQKLHEEGYPVNLTIDRSFSSLSAVVSPLLHHVLDKKMKVKEKYAHHFPLGSSVIAFAVVGVSIGTTLAGLIASIGVILTSFVTAMGYYTSLFLSLIPGLMLLANILNALFNAHANYLSTCFDIVATTIGGVTAVAGLIVGALMGVALGVVLSFQLLFTKDPYNVSLKVPTSALLNTTTGEISSVKNIQSILSFKEHGKIKIINSKEDEVVHPEAALNTGLGFTSHAKHRNVSSNLTSIWYNKGDHAEALQEYDIDDELSYVP